MKQTAVEWLVQEMINNGLDYPISEMSKILEQAKEMEKQQIIDAVVDTQKEYIIQASCYPPQFILDKAFNYYEERFNNNN
jgi:hypothetical protein